MDEREAAAARRKQALLDAALTLLLHRAGGSLTFTGAEYDEAVATYGGASRVNLHFEMSASGTVNLSLEEKVPANAELMS